MADSKNFGMLKQTEKMKTGIRYLATLFRIALAFFMFWNWNARYVRFAIIEKIDICKKTDVCKWE